MRLKFIFLLMLFIFSFTVITSCRNRTKPRQRPIPQVKTAVIEQRDIPIYFDAIGQVISPVTVQVRPQVSGKLISAHIQEGDFVEEGELLYNIDPSPFQTALDQAKAQLAKDQATLTYAEKTVERYKTVVEDDFISKLTFEQYNSNANAARGQVEADKAAIAAAEINLGYTQVKASVAGKISNFAVDVGNILTAYDANAITVIRPSNPIDISFSLPQHQFELIRNAQGNDGPWKFVAILPNDSKVYYEGESYFIDNQIDQNTGTILLKGRLANPKHELWPGGFVRVKVLQIVAKDALVVPPGAVLIGKDGAYLYIVDKEGKAEAFNVIVLTRTDDYIAITSKELNPGDAVITDGQVNIAPGMTVNR